MTAKPFARLPTAVVPRKYFLDYHVVDLERFRFEVSERVELEIRESTRSITCHAVDLHVFGASVEVGGRRVACVETRYLSAAQSVELVFAEPLPAAASALLRLECHGTLNDALKGFYRSEYSLGGETRAMAVTQFEACDARRAFACWDEPAVKAAFEISITTDAALTAISNTHVVQTLVRPKKNAHLRAKSRTDATIEKVWRFAETPVMSTYLVGMIVGEFDHVSSVTPEGVFVSVYTPVGRSERGRFALDVGARALSFYAERFGIAYPLKKLDMLAIPDFAAGAMENWGVVTYRETALLVDSQLSSFAQRMQTSRTVCHEIAHQWFGNLVTMDWWTGLWLNEGFARFMEFEAVDHIFPQWNVWETFVHSITMSTAMGKDSMQTSHPVEVPVNHPDEVDQIFDVISYAKGASVIRMLSEHLGRDVFYRGIHDYLVRFSYRNTTTDDLWAALEKASGQSITSLADSWTRQTGFPVVHFDGKTLTQERFFADQSFTSDSPAVWDIPIAFVSSDKPDEVQRVGIWAGQSGSSSSEGVKTPLTLTDASMLSKMAAAGGSEGSWVKLNPGQSGFYLVNYSAAGWQRLQQPVREQLLDAVDRVSLLNSVFTFAHSGVVPVSQALNFSFAYAGETEYLCWKEISANLREYSALFSQEDFFPQLQRYIRALYAGAMERLTWTPANGESDSTRPFRQDVISMLTLGEDEAVVDEAKRRFAAYFSDSSALAADVRGVVFNAQARRGDKTHARKLRERYEASDFIEEKLDCLRALGLFRSTALKQEAVEWALKAVRSQDIQYVFASVAADVAGAEFAWTYVQLHWAELSAAYSPLVLGRIVLAVVGRFQTEQRAVEVDAFLLERKHASYSRLLDAALERIRIKSACYSRMRGDLAQWLQQQT